jgi:DNA repair exonuclease SbcCD ATPase subunit
MQEKVFTVCERLSKSGIKPTAERVRNELGSGSFTTISPIIKQWRESQVKTEPIEEIPPEAIKAVHQATAVIWAIANDHQAEAINAIKQEYTRHEQETNAERDEALREIAFLEQKTQSQEEHIQSKTAQAIAKESELQACKLEIQNQQFIIQHLSQSLEELKAENKVLQIKVETAQSEASKLEGMLEVYKAQTKTLSEPNHPTEEPTEPQPPVTKPKPTRKTSAKKEQPL